MKKSSGKRASLSQGVLAATTKDVGRLNKQANEKKLQTVGAISEVDILNDDEKLEITPRQGTPSKSISVEKPKLLAELRLSDIYLNEDEQNPTRPQPHGLQVLLTETKDDGVNNIAVETNTSSVQSHARVICHSRSPSPPEGAVPSAMVVDAEAIPVSQYGGDSGKKDGSQRKKKRYLPVQSRYKNNPTTSKDDTINVSAIPKTQSKSNSAGKGLKKKAGGRGHSTPYQLSSTYEGQNACDGSIFDITTKPTPSVSSHHTVTEKPAVKKPIKTSKTGRTKTANGDKSNDEASKDGAPLTQLQLDLKYSRVLQMQYIHMKARQTFEKQEKKAKTEMYGLYVSNEKLVKEINQLKQSVETSSANRAVAQLLQPQADGLKEIEKKFSQVVVNTSKLEDALTNTAHYLPIKNVLINEGELIKTLDESKKLLGEIVASTRNNQPSIEELSKNTVVLKRTLTTELAEQKQCHDLLAQCRSLTNHERSLQVQVIQSDTL